MPRRAPYVCRLRYESLRGATQEKTLATRSGFLWPLVTLVGLPGWQVEFDRLKVLVGDLLQQMSNPVQAGMLLVLGIDDVPG